jgi:hypothetical protein
MLEPVVGPIDNDREGALITLSPLQITSPLVAGCEELEGGVSLRPPLVTDGVFR